eukprot:TCONS_00047110-protein
MNKKSIIPLIVFISILLMHCGSGDGCECKDYTGLVIVNNSGSHCNKNDGINRWTCPSLQATFENKDISLNDSCICIVVDKASLNKTFHITAQRLIITSDRKSNIKCSLENETGLSFNASSNIEITSLIFTGCGHVDPSISQDLNISSAFFFQNSKDITLKNVNITSAEGYAFYFRDCTSKIEMQFVDVRLNRLKLFGGGVIVIKEKYVEPMKMSLNGCCFSILNAYEPDKQILEPFGYGGALSIHISKCDNNQVIIGDHTGFQRNSAISGGAVSVHIGKSSTNNTFKFDGIIFTGNTAVKSGGAVDIVTKEYTHPFNNTFIFSGCTFKDNTAGYYGGAFSQSKTFRTYHEMPKTDDFYGTHFISCFFLLNSAKLGAAIYLDDTYVIFDAKPNNPSTISQNNREVGNSNFAALFAYSTDILIKGELICKENSHTAFVLDYSYLHVNNTVLFTRNIGNKGGAISLYEESTIFFYGNGLLNFTENSALKGGAIYCQYEVAPIRIFNNNGYLSYRCFYSIIQSTREHVMLFTNNTASEGQGKTIYASTLNYCHIQQLENAFDLQHNDGISSINTDPKHLSISESQWQNLYPGKVFSPTVNLTDDLGNSVSAIVQIKLSSKSVAIDQNYTRFLVTSNQIQRQLSFVGSSKSNKSFKITISATSGTSTPKTIETNIQGCIFGYEFNERNEKCECSQNNRITRCEGDNVYFHKDQWVYRNSTKDIHTCPQFYCKCHNDNETNDCLYKANEQCNTDRDQTSKVCSKCKSGTTVGFGGNKCNTHCKNSYGIFWILVVLMVTIFIVMYLLIIVDIDIYKNYLNSTFYFYQIVSMFFTSVNLYIDPVIWAFKSVFILEGFHIANTAGVCILERFDELDKLFFNYLFPIFAFAWIGLIFLLGKKFNWFSYKTDNYIHASIFVIVWAYGDLARVSFKIFKFVTISNHKYVFVEADIPYFHSPRHQAYLIIASLIFVLIVAFPFILMFSYKINPKYPYLIPFFDYYKSYLKDDSISQLFASYYFICRILLSIIETFFFTDRLGAQKTLLSCISLVVFIVFAAVKPYKTTKEQNFEYLNIYDSVILFLLSNVAILTCANGSLAAENPNIKVNNILLNIILAAPAIWVALNFLYRLCSYLVKKWRERALQRRVEDEEDDHRRALLRESLIQNSDVDDDEDDDEIDG